MTERVRPGSVEPAPDELHALVDGLSEVVCRLRADRSQIYANQAGRRLLGDRNFLDAVPETDAALVESALSSLGAERSAVSVAHRVLASNGESHWMRTRFSLAADDPNGLSGFVAVAFDASRERSLEEQLVREERMASIGTLTAGIVHELNNPLGAILLAAQSALRSLDPATSGGITREALELIESEALRCGRIVKSVVSFTQGGPSGPGRVDDAARNACQLTRKFIAGFGGDVVLELEDDLPDVLASQTALEQIVVSLIRSAVEVGVAERVLVQAARADEVVRLRVVGEGRSDAAERELPKLVAVGDLLRRLGAEWTLERGQEGGLLATVRLPVAR